MLIEALQKAKTDKLKAKALQEQSAAKKEKVRCRAGWGGAAAFCDWPVGESRVRRASRRRSARRRLSRSASRSRRSNALTSTEPCDLATQSD